MSDRAGKRFAVQMRRGRGEVPILALEGELDLAAAETLANAAARLDGSGGKLVVDLNELTFIDSTGLRAVLQVQRQVEDAGGSLAVVCSGAQPRRVLQLTGLLDVFDVHATVDDALR